MIEKSIIKEQEIEVPNNFYVLALAIKLAIAYKIKQNADITTLQAQYEKILEYYYKSESNDSWTNYRINNIY